MPFSSFVNLLFDSRSPDNTHLGVPYIQHQNGSFLEEYSSLVPDASCDIPWASEAFGCEPDAVNFWMGDERAVTSFHKDHYENMYCVLAGEKHFTLLPPGDLRRLYVTKYPATRYCKTEAEELEIVAESPPQMVPWSPVDPYPADVATAHEKYPLFFREGPAPITCTVRAGEIFYL
eukprot:TRINITY_DN1424_c0_g1_i2.p1 TRINITY_DN1424_c0_g1~~TRINITY_DN1424_c0_g1_i2.p1  ORF type:complete len:176 (-),score=28.16 TRINITY_DN1424_c0_g1_i2:30-557(-)